MYSAYTKVFMNASYMNEITTQQVQCDDDDDSVQCARSKPKDSKEKKNVEIHFFLPSFLLILLLFFYLLTLLYLPWLLLTSGRWDAIWVYLQPTTTTNTPYYYFIFHAHVYWEYQREYEQQKSSCIKAKIQKISERDKIYIVTFLVKVKF